MKWYRIVDDWGEPYGSGYNSTNLYDIADSISGLADGDGALEDDPAYTTDNIYQALLRGERDFIFNVEESDVPFAAEGYDRNNGSWSHCTECYSDKAIIDYFEYKFPNVKYDEDELVDSIWQLGDINQDEFVEGIEKFGTKICNALYKYCFIS